MGFEPSVGVLAGAVLFDVLVGELPTRFHPVVWIGRAIEAVCRRIPRGRPAIELVAGAVVACGIPLVAAGLACLALRSGRWLPGGEFVVSTFLLTSTFAATGLAEAAMRVCRALEDRDLEAARHGLRSLCSRDPSHLEGPELAAGAIESLAENASDSVVAPLFYYALLGIWGAVFYRAVNTLDAMIGYRGEYEYLGKASARLDDALNFVPARITAALLVVAGRLVGADAAAGVRVWRRDAARTASPNAGRPMAVMAGLLGVRLTKRDHYTLGDGEAQPGPAAIRRAWSITRGALALAFVGAAMGIGLR